MKTQHGYSVADLSRMRPVLLVFLRHFGCTFCREAMGEISAERDRLEAANVEIVLVHMGEPEVADKYFKKYKLEGVNNISDPDCAFYKSFGLLKGNFHQLFGLQSWVRGFDAGVIQGHWVGYRQLGDGFQMPGAFSIRDGEVQGSFVHKVASDKPDYWELVNCCTRTLAGEPLAKASS